MLRCNCQLDFFHCQVWEGRSAEERKQLHNAMRQTNLTAKKKVAQMKHLLEASAQEPEFASLMAEYDSRDSGVA